MDQDIIPCGVLGLMLDAGCNHEMMRILKAWEPTYEGFLTALRVYVYRYYLRSLKGSQRAIISIKLETLLPMVM